MIGRYSDCLDIKRLLGAMNKEAKLRISTSTAKKRTLCDLFQKLKKIAYETGNEQISLWCDERL
jgi:hypothetical protein